MQLAIENYMLFFYKSASKRLFLRAVEEKRVHIFFLQKKQCKCDWQAHMGSIYSKLPGVNVLLLSRCTIVERWHNFLMLPFSYL